MAAEKKIKKKHGYISNPLITLKVNISSNAALLHAI